MKLKNVEIDNRQYSTNDFHLFIYRLKIYIKQRNRWMVGVIGCGGGSGVGGSGSGVGGAGGFGK